MCRVESKSRWVQDRAFDVLPYVVSPTAILNDDVFLFLFILETWSWITFYFSELLRFECMVGLFYASFVVWDECIFFI